MLVLVLVLVEEGAWAADILAEEAAKNATSAARLATSLGIVPRATVEVEEAATEVEDTVEEDTEEVQAVEEAEEVKPATLAEAMATCLVTAPKARNATTVASKDI